MFQREENLATVKSEPVYSSYEMHWNLNGSQLKPIPKFLWVF
jgi:hypothetical protein